MNTKQKLKTKNESKINLKNSTKVFPSTYNHFISCNIKTKLKRKITVKVSLEFLLTKQKLMGSANLKNIFIQKVLKFYALKSKSQ